jgi:hypothetical protein
MNINNINNLNLYKLLFAKPINNYNWLFCNNDKIKDLLINLKNEEINFINSKVKEQTDLDIQVLDYGYCHTYYYTENRELMNKYIIVHIKNYKNGIIVAFINNLDWNNMSENCLDSDYNNDSNSNYSHNNFNFVINDEYFYYHYDCESKEYIFNKELDEKLLNLTFVLEYNLEYDKYNNDL